MIKTKSTNRISSKKQIKEVRVRSITPSKQPDQKLSQLYLNARNQKGKIRNKSPI
jgi:hypothetical protein